LHGFFETLYLENKPNNIRTSVIIPKVRTSISIHALDQEGKEHGRMDDGLTRESPRKKLPEPSSENIRNKRRYLLEVQNLLCYISEEYGHGFFSDR